jgi:hypothetical protein
MPETTACQNCRSPTAGRVERGSTATIRIPSVVRRPGPLGERAEPITLTGRSQSTDDTSFNINQRAPVKHHS